MITTGTKLLVGSAAVAALAAFVYGVATGGALGTIGLTGAAAGLAILAGANIIVRDSNVSAMDHDAFASAPANQTSARGSLWPLLAGLGATMIALGLVTNSVVFVLGFGALFAAAVEWLLQGWSERASADVGFNEQARQQFSLPLELPAGGAILAGVIVFAFSRVMLGLPSKSATVVAFSVLAALVLIAGFMVAMRRNLSQPALVGSFALGVVAVAAVGTVYGFAGPRHIHEHETLEMLAEEGECVDTETHADENASQTVAAKSNVSAELLYDGESLVAKIPGFDDEFETLTLPRSNTNNIIFRNESDGDARVVIEVHPGEDATTPEQHCSALVEEGGASFMSVVFPRNTRIVEAETGEGFAFTVPGTDAELEVIVP